MYVETIFETGAKSVAFYETEEEMLSAVKAQHERAKAGEDGGPGGHPAERIVEVQVYNTHPQDLNEDMTMSADVMKKELEAIIKSATEAGVVNIQEVAASVRNLASPVPDEVGRHDSMFKMEAEKVVTEGWDS
jgi:hypothetical protein